jgi:hypothetical protein
VRASIVRRFRHKASRGSGRSFLAETVLAETVVRIVHSCCVHDASQCAPEFRKSQATSAHEPNTFIYTTTQNMNSHLNLFCSVDAVSVVFILINIKSCSSKRHHMVLKFRN